MTGLARNTALLIGSLLLARMGAAQEAAQPPHMDRALLASKAASLYRAGAMESKPRIPMAMTGADPARAWKDHMTRGAGRDDEGDGCLLSFALGGDLDIRGYKGIRLFGAARTLSLPRKETR